MYHNSPKFLKVFLTKIVWMQQKVSFNQVKDHFKFLINGFAIKYNPLSPWLLTSVDLTLKIIRPVVLFMWCLSGHYLYVFKFYYRMFCNENQLYSVYIYRLNSDYKSRLLLYSYLWQNLFYIHFIYVTVLLG